MKQLWGFCLFSWVLLWMAVPVSAQSPDTVLVVANTNNAQSVALADYYRGKRGIPVANELLLTWTADDNADTISLADYNVKIAAPIYAKIRSLGRIDYIVLCRNLPSMISDTLGSVDSALAGKTTVKSYNPYYQQNAAFATSAFGIYLVTRLDGWSWADAKALVDRSLSARPAGLFYLHEDPTKQSDPVFSIYNLYMSYAGLYVQGLGLPAQVDATTAFTAPSKKLAGYFSWGSNDANYNATAFASLTFEPGAIAETLVSTSASNIRYPGGWQSQIAQLVRDGVTGVKGYVSEPLVSATARPQLLFYFYAQGGNLAESYYGASPYVGWKDVVLGDPLCAPYRLYRGAAATPVPIGSVVAPTGHTPSQLHP